MPNKENIDLAEYRLQKARNCLAESENEEVQTQLEQASKFVKEAERYINNLQ